MKKIIFIIMIPILFISCSSLKSVTKEPEVTFDSVKITNINFSSADFIFKYKVDNPNNISINVEQFTYDLIIENNKFISGISQSPISVAKSSSSFIDVPVTISYMDLYNLFSDIYKLDNANYILKTDFVLKLPVFGKKTFHLEHKGNFPVLKMPEIALKDIKALSINPFSAVIELSVDIINKNSFAISPDNFNFELYINKSQWLKGLLKNIDSLAPGKSTTVKIPIEINPAKVGKELFDYIFSSNGLDIFLKGNMAMRTSYPGIGTADIPFSLEKTISVKK